MVWASVINGCRNLGMKHLRQHDVLTVTKNYLIDYLIGREKQIFTKEQSSVHFNQDIRLTTQQWDNLSSYLLKYAW